MTSCASSSSRRRGPSRGSKPLPDGKKKKVGVNLWSQPIRGVNSYSTTVETLTRNHIPINYKKFTNVPDEFIHNVKTVLEVKVKATPHPFVPKEVWVEFVDMYNSDAFQAQSKNNIENHNKVKVPCTTGQTSMAVVRHNLAIERNAPDEDVGRADVFIKAHTKANKTNQCPKIIEKLQENMNLHPDSNKIDSWQIQERSYDEKKGHMMAIGIDITPSFVANAIHIVEENEDLKATNNELKTMLLNMRKDLDNHIKKTSGAPQIQPSSYCNAPSNSSQATQRKQSDLNREYKLNGCLEGIVAYGIVADVSPDAYCHNKQLGDGYNKIEIFNVINEDPLLFSVKCNINQENPEVYTIEKLAKDYQIIRQRVHAILWLKEIEEEEEKKYGSLGDSIERLLDTCPEQGLVTKVRNNIEISVVPFVRGFGSGEIEGFGEGVSLLDVVKKVKPHVLLGLSGVGGIFTEEISD
ncbi:hypothetical protein GIB67_028140 [Kingdonia uniflora]|uniref:Malic enzyme NAD-binding domain-containing protein n=1 Tax=Kingdonia uniflora TaxID=39325 RepID=A0A7J7KZM0_9MAGN|nr:hypothetical protein GIB67_028140 [Kingdonia uniflora]